MTCLSLDKLLEGVKDKKTRNQRIHEAVRAHECSLKEAGESRGLSYPTISRIAPRAEKNEMSKDKM